jgi:hypothetical protein
MIQIAEELRNPNAFEIIVYMLAAKGDEISWPDI